MHFSLKNTRLSDISEAEYRAHYLRNDAVQASVGTIIFMIPIALFIIKDYQFAGWSPLLFKLAALRLLALINGGVLLYRLRRVKDFRRYDRDLFVSALIAIGAIVLINLSRPPDYYIFAAVDMAVLAVIYTIVPTKLLNQIALGMIFTTADILLLEFTGSQPVQPMLSTILPGFILVNSVGVASSGLLQTFRRGQYSSRVKEGTARRSLEMLAAQLEDAQAVAKVGSWMYSPATDETSWSAEMFRIYGADPSEDKKTFTDGSRYMSPESWTKLKSAIAFTRETGAPNELELDIVRPDGARRTVLSRWQIKNSAHEPGPVLIGTCQDITELKRKERIISASLREKEVLLKEIQHRVKNNMQVISSLLQMQSQFVHDEDDARMFQESQDRIHSMSLVYDQLCRSDDLAEIHLKTYITNLVEKLIHSYGAGGAVSSLIDVDDICVGLDAAIPCGLMANELVANSMKYAFLHGGAGKIIVSIHKAGDMLDMTVADDGVGLPEDLDVASGATLGMTLLHTLGEQLGGKVEFRKGKGTVFHTSFSLNQPEY